MKRSELIKLIKEVKQELYEVKAAAHQNKDFNIGDVVTFNKGYGYWDVTKYPYGGDFNRFKGNEKGKVIDGTVAMVSEIRVKLDDNRTIIVNAWEGVKTKNGSPYTF